MAAYAGWMTACTPGSASGPMLGIEYGKPLPLPFLSVLELGRTYFLRRVCSTVVRRNNLLLPGIFVDYITLFLFPAELHKSSDSL